MAWFEAHEELPRHPKTLKLARTLRMSKYETIGLLWCLFSWGLTAARKDGALPGMTASDIAMALDWPAKKAGELVDALLYAGYLERTGDTFYIHDWYDYSGKLMDKREADKLRKSAERAGRRGPENTGNSAPCPPDIQRTSDGNPIVTVPNSTVPDSTIENSEDNYPPADGTMSDDIVCRTKDVRRIVSEWNALGLGQVKNISPESQRAKLLRTRVKQNGVETVIAAIRRIRDSAFLQGQNQKSWIITFDWFLKPGNFQKVLEGNYDSREARAAENPTGMDALRALHELYAEEEAHDEEGDH